jgi:hypothetical protein
MVNSASYWYRAGAIALLWLIFGTTYINHRNGQQHDLSGNLRYTKDIGGPNWIPSPKDGPQHYHPPAFFMLAKVFPLDKKNKEQHITNVRRASFILFGGIFALCLLASLQVFVGPSYLSLLISAWILWTPAVLQTMTSYNNDAMSASMAIVTIIACTYFVYTPARKSLPRVLQKSAFWAGVMLLSLSIGMHTKYTTGAVGIILITALLGLTLTRKITMERRWVAIGLLALGGLSILPWCYLHNYHHTNTLFPHSHSKGKLRQMPYAELERYGGYARFVSDLPFVDIGQWKTPYAYDYTRYPKEAYWTKQNLANSLITTGLFGEWDHGNWEKTPTRYALSWAILVLDSLIFFTALFIVILKKRNRLLIGLLAIFYGIIMAFLWQVPYINAANMRYFVAMWVLVGLIVAAGTNGFPSLPRLSSLTSKYMLLLLSLSITSKIAFCSIMNT